MKPQHPITDPRPFGKLAGAAVAAALAMRLRGRKDDQHWADLLDRLGRRAQMYLAGRPEEAQHAKSDSTSML